MCQAYESGKVPRHTVAGIIVTTFVHMTKILDQMIPEIKGQRYILEIVLIKFFKGMGMRGIETLLGRL
ncbi:hypothetical protein J5TS2_20650 [Brevibacillus halotolerans]|nr:hypothetical protein J5TS2_20650 [Brevibacillus halotolerans]